MKAYKLTGGEYVEVARHQPGAGEAIGVRGLGHMAVAYLRALTGGPLIALDRSQAARDRARKILRKLHPLVIQDE
jgi:D-arabinose 1-dehydrogenase-like Zn-dependent alcohol dehydrogenase